MEYDFTDGSRCPECGEELYNDPGFGYWECYNCGFEYYEPGFDSDDIPWGCQTCGGPYPQCMTSCKVFDD